MTVPLYWRKWTRPVALGLAILVGLLIACGGEEAAPTQVATAVPDSTLPPTATSAPASAPSTMLAPTSTPAAGPLSTPSQSVATPVPSPLPTPVPTLLPRAAELQLEVTAPAEDTVVTSDSVTVAGLASPDATVSVNGILVTPDVEGRFAIELPMSSQDNPLSIEVIATSVAGERRAVVRTVIFIP